MALDPAAERKVINFINIEAERIGFGKLFIEVTVADGRSTNIQCETKRSVKL